MHALYINTQNVIEHALIYGYEYAFAFQVCNGDSAHSIAKLMVRLTRAVNNA